jgi:hypothetical protein
MTCVQSTTGGLRNRQHMRWATPGSDLWMIDHAGSTMLHCRCLEVVGAGMRLCVPARYGVMAGQRYELRPHAPGERPSALPPASVTMWVTVVQTPMMKNENGDRMDIRVVPDCL